MSEKNTTPTFNMKVVVRETGLKPDTLRAWERRYGLPDPTRTSGGHRLYSEYEIEMLKWLMERQEEGLSISHAVDLWRQLEEEGQDPLDAYGEPEEPNASPVIVTGESVAEMRKAWLDACLTFDETRSQQILAQAFAIFSAETVCVEVLQRGLREIGEGWYRGDVTVQQEHFASALAIRQLEALLTATRIQPRHGKLLLACPPGEQHTFSPLMLALMLRHRSWDVVYLGANVPSDRMEKTARMVQPKLVILVAQTLITAGNMLPMAKALQDMGLTVSYGGRVFHQIPALREHIPGHYLGDKLEDTPAAIDHLTRNPPQLSAIREPSAAMQETLAHFREQRPAVEAYLYDYLNVPSMDNEELANANAEFGDNIVAALRLGDLNLVTANLKWLQGLLVNFHFPMAKEALATYLQAYGDAVQARMDKRGDLLVDWLSTMVAEQAEA